MDSLEDRQIKNLKNKLVDYIRKHATDNLTIRLALICKVKVPKTLIEKLLNSD